MRHSFQLSQIQTNSDSAPMQPYSIGGIFMNTCKLRAYGNGNQILKRVVLTCPVTFDIRSYCLSLSAITGPAVRVGIADTIHQLPTEIENYC